MDKKRGQVSVFIVVGIILLIIVSLWLYFQRGLTAQPELIEAPPDVKAVQQYVEQCLKTIAAPSAYLLAFNGGVLPEVLADQPVSALLSDFLITSQRILPYFLVNGQKKSADDVRARAEQHLSASIQKNLPACTGFAGFLAQGMFITEGAVRAETTITPTKIRVAADYPLEITKEEKTYELRKFSVDVPLRLGLLLRVADEISDIVRADPSRAHLPEFSRLSAKHNVRITLLPFHQDATAYALYDNDDSFWIDDAPFIFWFAVKNSFSGEGAGGAGGVPSGASPPSASALNTPPQFANLKDFVLRRGAPFEYRLEANDREGDAVAFSSDSTAFSVSPAGMIRTMPLQRGTFFVTFIITDSRGLANEKKARFVVE